MYSILSVIVLFFITFVILLGHLKNEMEIIYLLQTLPQIKVTWTVDLREWVVYETRGCQI